MNAVREIGRQSEHELAAWAVILDEQYEIRRGFYGLGTSRAVADIADALRQLDLDHLPSPVGPATLLASAHKELTNAACSRDSVDRYWS